MSGLPRPGLGNPHNGSAYWGLTFTRGVLAIPKRKPPSRRPERKLDDVAKAIARARDDAKPEKSAEPSRLASDASRPPRIHPGKGTAPRKVGGPAVAPSTKRPKSGES